MNPSRTSRNVLDFRFSRRTLLKGAGVAVALPWLESVRAFGAGPAAAAGEVVASAAANLPPKRVAVIFMANGINFNHWYAKGSGAGMELSKTLAPMEPFKEKMNVISGLFNKAATGVGIHPGQTGNLLSGAHLTKGAEVHGGDLDGPGAGESFRRADDCSFDGAGLRAAGDGLSRNEFFDGLQLAHLLAKRNDACAAGRVSGPGVGHAL